MSIQPSIPFALAAGGTVAVDTDPDVQISKRIRTLVSTQPGERVMWTGYGVPLATLLFEPEDVDQPILEDMVKDAIAEYEPGVYVQIVNPTWNADGDRMVAVEVNFQRADSPNTPISQARSLNTAVIAVGGEVTETVVA